MANVNSTINLTKTLGMVEGTITFAFSDMVVTVFVNGSRQQFALTKMGLVRFGKKIQAGQDDVVGISVIVDFADFDELPNEEVVKESLEIAGKRFQELALEDKLEVFYN